MSGFRCLYSRESGAAGFPDFNNAAVLVAGAGDTVDLVLRHLQAHGVTKLFIANRNLKNAELLAQKYPAKIFPFARLSQALLHADIVITATGSTLPIMSRTLIETTQAARAARPLHIIDLAVPRDVEASAATLSGVALYCIDDLKEMIQNNMRGREHAADKAREVIAAKAAAFIAWIKSFDLVTTTIRVYRKQIEDICFAEMAKAVQQLNAAMIQPRCSLLLRMVLPNKLLHSPSVQLRQAGFEGRFDILELAQQLFAIPHTETGTL